MSEEELLNQAAEKAKNLLSIEQKTGGVILRVPKVSLTAKAAVGVQLVERYFSDRMRLADSQAMSTGGFVHFCWNGDFNSDRGWQAVFCSRHEIPSD